MPARAAKGAFLPGRGRGAIFCGAAFGRPARSARAGRAGKGQTVPEQHRAHKRHKACRRAAKAGPALAAVRVARAAFPSAGPFTASILAQAGPDIPDIPDKTGFLGHWRQNGLEKRPRALPVPANGSNKGRLHTVVSVCSLPFVAKTSFYPGKCWSSEAFVAFKTSSITRTCCVVQEPSIFKMESKDACLSAGALS